MSGRIPMAAQENLKKRHGRGNAMKTDLLAVAPSLKSPTVKVLLAHTPQMRRDYYGERSLNGLRAVAEVKLHEGEGALDAAVLITAARDVEIIVADRMTQGPGEIFPH